MVHVPRSITPDPTTTPRTIITEDGFELAAYVFNPATPARANVLIHGATAVAQGYYRRFAEFVAAAGYRVITYDYRGVGESRPRSLRGFDATMTDWAVLDAAAVIDQVLEYPEPVVAIGHSFGGQLMGLVDSAREVDVQILVAAQFGSYRHWPWRDQLKFAAIWHGVVPVATALTGYLPKQLGLGEDLPAGVAREWARWCRSPNYLLDHVEGAAARFALIDAPTLMYSFTDDEYAPAPAVEALAVQLTGADLHHRRITPADIDHERIGHFGFFRVDKRNSLWRDLVGQLARVLRRGDFAAPRVHVPRSDWDIDAATLRAALEYGR